MRRMPSATLRQALSLFDQSVTALPFSGRASSLPNGAVFQSQSRTMIGMTIASPASCRPIATFISFSQQYLEAMKLGLTNSKMILSLYKRSSMPAPTLDLDQFDDHASHPACPDFL